jgi:hypothetical protein
MSLRSCGLQARRYALTESEDDTEEESACASRWIICSTKLYVEVAVFVVDEVPEVEDAVEAAAVVMDTFDPSA